MMYVESSEWMRFRNAIVQCCGELGKPWFFWNPADGLSKADKSEDDIAESKDFMDLLRWIRGEFPEGSAKMPKNAVCILELADALLRDDDAAAAFAVMTRSLSGKNQHVILLSPTLTIPAMVKKEIAVLDFPLPNRDDIKTLLNLVAKTHEVENPDASPAILDSVRGLGATEIRNAFAKTAVDCNRITAEEIPRLVAEKEQIIRKSGYLTFVRPEEKMADVGGLENLTEWLQRRKNAFGADARAAKLNAPKGVLLLGIPGTGKSLCAKAVAHEWQMPLLRLDMGSVFSSGVGDSEANMRGAIKTAEGLEPCVLWIDEIEKGVGGGRELDGGTSARVFGSFLTWMQEKKKEVFIVATANDLSRLPPEMLRKGRFDEIFFVDLPGKEARRAIFCSHLKHKGQDIASSNNDDLLKKTEGFSGSEIEAVVNDALFMAYESGKDEAKITVKHLMDATESIVPLSRTMGETISKLREWAKNRCRMASNAEDAPAMNADRAPRLHSESYDNWFAPQDSRGDSEEE